MIFQQGSLQVAAQVHQGGLEGGPAGAKVGRDAQRCQDAGLVQPGNAQFGLVWLSAQFGLVSSLILFGLVSSSIWFGLAFSPIWFGLVFSPIWFGLVSNPIWLS